MSSPAQIILFASRAFSLKLYNIINWTHMINKTMKKTCIYNYFIYYLQ